MKDRPEALRRRIATYRRHLAEGVDLELAQRYLIEIAAAEAEFARIEQDGERRHGDDDALVRLRARERM